MRRLAGACLVAALLANSGWAQEIPFLNETEYQWLVNEISNIGKLNDGIKLLIHFFP